MKKSVLSKKLHFLVVLKEVCVCVIRFVLGHHHQCEKCGSWDTKHANYWARGWNNYCGQAYADSGAYCNECHHISWDTSLEEHLKILPNWCTPYGMKKPTAQSSAALPAAK